MTGRTIDAKVELRQRMRTMRRALEHRDARSEQLWRHVRSIDRVADAGRVLAFSTIPGEPHTAPLVDWCRERDVAVAVPEDDVDPSWPDVAIVPGLAFTPSGQRLGQGGGWYDRFLTQVRPDCLTIGVAFVEQVVDDLPTEPHDVAMAVVVTDRGPCR